MPKLIKANTISPRQTSSRPPYAVGWGLNSNKVSPFLVPFVSYGQAKREGYSSYSKSMFGVDYGLKPNTDLSKVHYKMVDPIRNTSSFNKRWYREGTSPAVNFLVGAGLGVVSIVGAPVTATAATIGAIAYSGFTTAIDKAVKIEAPKARTGDQLYMYHYVGLEDGDLTAVWQYWLVDKFRNKKGIRGIGAWLIAEERSDNISLHDSMK